MQVRNWLMASAGACGLWAVLFGQTAAAQATIDNGAATSAQIAGRLQGGNITITNPNIPAGNNSDGADMYGLFSNGIAGAGLQIDRGAAFSTGSIAAMFTNNNSPNASVGGSTEYSDPAVVAINSLARWNVALLTMDVTLPPYVTGLRVRYQFGSDEYPDYVGSNFNDFFAILLSGPGISGSENIATLPNADDRVVSINNVNVGSRGCFGTTGSLSSLDSGLYINNGHITTIDPGTGRLTCNPASQPGPFPVHMQWNGLTEALNASRTGLTPGTTYQLKIAVADVGDPGYDSGAVFELIEGTFSRDYGDAPSSYGDPYHSISSAHHLGAAVTADSGPYFNPTASGDADDGVAIPSLAVGVAATIFATVSGAGGYLQSWFDWNADGDFDDPGEQVAVNLQDTDGDGQISFQLTPPAGANLGGTFARFRWSTQQDLGPDGAAADGEVEDYFVSASGGSPTLTCPAGWFPVVKTGHAGAVTTTAEFSANALGPIQPAGVNLNNANAARVRSGFTPLGVQLEDFIPAGASMIVSLARDNSAGSIAIETSSDGVSFTAVGNFNSGPNLAAQRFVVTIPSGGARFVRFSQIGGNVWIDGVQYSSACATTPPLTGHKSIEVYDPASAGLYATPGNDVIYSLRIENTGAAATDSGSLLLVDRIPAELDIFNGPTPEFNGGAAGWSETGTSLTFSAASDLRWSNAASAPASFSACTYVPAPGYDPAIRHVCLNPKGVLPAGDPNPEFTVRLRARIR